MKQAIVYWKTLKAGILTLTDRKTDFAIIQHLPCGRKANPIAKVVIKNDWLTSNEEVCYTPSLQTTVRSSWSLIKSKRHSKSPSSSLPDHTPLRTNPTSNISMHSSDNTSPKPLLSPIFPLISLPILNETKLNNRPRKELGYKSPFQCFFLNSL